MAEASSVNPAPRPGMVSDDGPHPSERSQRRLAKIIAGALPPPPARTLRPSSSADG